MLTSTVYVATVVFDPSKKWRALERLWSQLPFRETSVWKQTYETSLTTIWEEKYKSMTLEGIYSDALAGGNGCFDYVERRLAFSRSVAYSEPYPKPQVHHDRRTKLPTLLQAQDEFNQYLSKPPADNVS
jgi:hypothetical protein